ncbi:type I restriction endonuclease subunit R [Propionibacterium freudenreichii]|uniref:type I restriction endonuclease subunit R n=2 Tax=Propionibacterium freudenreichii TaxID=1744 RepID=UPI000BC2CCBF|nr:type I restriction endonuclease subunit R [Propionibacterium freudenreichii]MDK9676023.1 type I restriction endonuclease subunit R [Propionibacterium freudenreichii]SCQ45611.1 Type I site-specific deoxyribonuclease, HsdR family [Propionibacterium freudenreichii]SCQ50197.1 Type I site-specific deoxyribonuclease, HsdR family [Propionibacterium freudenreichii]
MSDSPARAYDPIAVSAESTVVAEYVPDPARAEAYQSEAALEREVIRLLEGQAYDYLPITSEAELVANLRVQLEKVNKTTFSDAEWEQFFTTKIAGANDGIVEKTVRIQEEHVQILKRDDGTTKNISLIDKTNIHNNRLQVINQYEIGRGEGDTVDGGARYANRYDVTVLVNGLPMVHIELKRRGVDIREAFNQINRYQRDSFWAGSGLFEYVQLFVISNGTLTKYYSNSTRAKRLDEVKKSKGAIRGKQSSSSFEFTSWWADASNKPITELTAFVRTFFAKHALLNILTKYCVLTADRDLLVMRPYQIVATERILQKIQISTNYKTLGTLDAGGYVWHTTGSGKTLTSFKSAQLASKMPSVDKVLFVVDRKDLDYQTMREYDRFEKGAANSNTSTAVLKTQLEDPSARIIITTIQKLSTFIKANKGHEVFSGHAVIIFDECHRSQFGDMHTDITRAFKKYNLFGFTGTPIFAANAGSGGNPQLRTTEQAFGDKLHTYTIVDAITDKNVLPFRIDYINTIKVGNPDDSQVSAIDRERALLDVRRIRDVVAYTLEHFDQKTKRSSSYEHAVVTNVADSVRGWRQAEAIKERKRVRGFNALFATASIDAARRYYNQFQLQMEELPPDKRLKVGLIFSYGANEAEADGILDDEAFDTDALDRDTRSFLEDAIQDYNDMFGTSYDTSADRFQNYYKDLSQRMKNREIDLVIVVNMFLTGFDATTLNTLFVDKNLRAHGLIQAYSRTNRILNSVKTYGNIVAFRDLEEETNAALELFGNKDARGVVLLKPYGDYYGEYVDKVTELLTHFPIGQQIVGEQAQKDFIQLFGAILRLQNILTSFDDFDGNDPLTERQRQDYTSIYLRLRDEFTRDRDGDREVINDDVVFEIELVKQVEINVDYILMLVEKLRAEKGDGEDKEVRAEITRAVDASPTLRSKRDLVEDFVESVSLQGAVDEQWQSYIVAKREAELQELIETHKLKLEETGVTRKFRTVGLVQAARVRAAACWASNSTGVW